MIRKEHVSIGGLWRRIVVSFPSSLALGSIVLALGLYLDTASAQDANAVVNQMVAREDAASEHPQHFSYMAVERSERTGGHLWKERVAETSAGKVRLLLAEDGQPVSPQRASAERARLAGIVADPREFTKTERAKGEEGKAKAMLDLLPKAYALKNARTEGNLIHIDFEPNPAYRTQSNEEKVLHGMSGTLAVDARALRLRELEGKLPQDVSVGFGLASIHAGSRFETAREMVTPGEWKTTVVDTDIHGRAIFFKSLGDNKRVTCTEFKQLPFDMSLAQAVELVER